MSESRDVAVKGKVAIQTVPLHSILDKYLPSHQEISFLSVDAEGFDLEVLKSNDWELYRPEIVLVEILEATTGDVFETEVHKFLISKDYTFYCKSPNTVFYKRLR